MARIDKAAARITELRADSAKRAGTTRERILEFYADVIESPEERTADRLKAAENLSRCPLPGGSILGHARTLGPPSRLG